MRENELRITLIRTSCLLIEYGPWNLITDPWFEDDMRGLPVYRKPGIPLEQLPKIHGVVASHLHRDHFDRAAVAKINNPDMQIFGPYGTKKFCNDIGGAQVTELANWDEAKLGPIRMMATPAEHTGPPPAEINYVLSLGPWKVFFGGDSRLSPAFAEIQGVAKRIDVALLPIGGTLIFGHRTTMDPSDAVEACRALKPRFVIPIHEGGEWQSVPPASQHPGRFTDFADELEASDLSSKACVLAAGESITFGEEERT
jgi:L-ascorbate metabolism protein UlaG (beta-lactamase superfamily)